MSLYHGECEGSGWSYPSIIENAREVVSYTPLSWRMRREWVVIPLYHGECEGSEWLYASIMENAMWVVIRGGGRDLCPFGPGQLCFFLFDHDSGKQTEKYQSVVLLKLT